ncbi:hypothetical protein LTR97_001920 [Elasticomyces elasticus]|uniref:Uncharacterized protein n=1 Tax=Elasticomyces elasticus TaxID=574655 RepID=A0AAN7ZQQ4_9PEZI|nr:hypothetical protein LTR97_001920 [Elasticomyces elasticus]KAK5710412.1 hypothetical protein LTR15_012974 [Elasticomyces elasticus]
MSHFQPLGINGNAKSCNPIDGETNSHKTTSRKSGKLEKSIAPSRPYKSLTEEEAEHFLVHGWLKVEGGFERQYIDEWLPDFWIRTGYDEHDKTTWKEEYLHVTHHRQVRNEDFCPKAWAKVIDLCGGEDRIHETRERWVGDNFIVNFGSEARSKEDPTSRPPQTKAGFHYDNDWYRTFLDSSSTAMTIVHCFTDIPKDGGGTWLCEDGMQGICEKLYTRPEGFDPVVDTPVLCEHTKDCHVFKAIEAKAGDTFIMHGLLPHTNSFNYKHYARVITNPHVTLKEPYNLDRGPKDGDYSLLEQVILRALGRPSIPEYHSTRPRMFWYPRNSAFKLNRVDDELARLKADRKDKGLPESSIDSVHLQGEEAMRAFNLRNGYDLPRNVELGLELEQHAA